MSAAPVAFITGAASGIGRATSVEFASRGYAVGVFDLSFEAARKVAEEIQTAGGQALAVEGDVSREGDVQHAVDVITKRFGDLQAAVACAGIEVPGEPTTLNLDQWHRAFAVNVDGVLMTARAAIPSMLRRGPGGAFVAISSESGFYGAAGWAPYVATKHAVVGLVRCMAFDYGPLGIRSNIVAPGYVDTPMAARLFEDAPDERPVWEKRNPLGRFATPEEIAKVVAHLASAESSYTNGSVYMVDGGQSAGIIT